ncbi:MAG: hypothetical protein U5J63_02685 [Fodinibius sp.]|nr:hypothetical protein [Fodinibius sp.]
MKLCKYYIAVYFLLWGFISAAVAQTGGSAGAFSRIGFGPRGMAMGNALTSVTSEGIYSYYNPAMTARAPTGNQVDLGTAAMSFDRSFNTATGTFRLPPSAGVSLSLINANVRGIDGRSTDGYDTGSLQTHEYQISSALGIAISSKLSVGIGLKYYLADYHSELSTASTLGLDVGALYQLSDNWQLGLTTRDLLAAYNWDSSTLYGDESSGRTDDFPPQYRIGASFSGISGLLISVEVGHIIYGNTSANTLRIGSSYRLHERITLRAGWQIDELASPKNSNHGSAGFSVHLPFDLLAPSIDYAFVQEGNNISYMHSFGLRLNI